MEFLKEIRNLLTNFEVNADQTLYKCIETAIPTSYYVFCSEIKNGPNKNYYYWYKISDNCNVSAY